MNVYSMLGISFTGFYVNPIEASALTLGCGSLSLWEHFKIYWISALLGWYAAELIYAVKVEPPRPKYSYEK